MTAPKRIQRQRTKGWTMPPGAVYVGRPSKWGNPFPVDGDWAMWTAVALGYKGHKAGRRAAAVALHRAWVTGGQVVLGPLAGAPGGGSLEFGDGSVSTMDEHLRGIASVAAALAGPLELRVSPAADIHELAGRDLCCWCPLVDGRGRSVPCHADVLLELASGGGA